MDRFQRVERYAPNIWRLVRAIFVFSLMVLIGCTRRSHPDDRIQLTDPPKAMAVQPLTPRLPDCPGPMASQLTDLHKVTLTWNVSSSSSGPNDRSVGYCVYRSDSTISADRLENCPGCQKITPTPIIGTSCVDNFGDGSKSYFYAAISMNASGRQSTFSNRISASLPKKGATPSSSVIQNPQSCRNPTPSQAPVQAKH